MSSDDDKLIARARDCLSAERIGAERFDLIVESLPTRQRQAMRLIAEALERGDPMPGAHQLAEAMGIHYTSAKRTMARLARSLAASVAVSHDIRNIPRNNN